MTSNSLLALAIAPLALVASVTAVLPCSLEAIGTVTVTAVRDGRTLMLDDGRELRLAAIEVPDDAAAKSALQTLIANRVLELKKLGGAQDRYGRLVAFAFIPDTGNSLQQALLADGHVVVAARVGDKTCAAELLAAERAAREARRGLWADPNFAPLRAEDGNSVLAQRGRFTLIEGKVLSVRESGSTIYVNFGRRWSRDFSVTILKRYQRMFASAGVEPKSLDGRRVRVRGWIEQRGGPIIEAARPEQIEIVE